MKQDAYDFVGEVHDLAVLNCCLVGLAISELLLGLAPERERSQGVGLHLIGQIYSHHWSA